MFEVANDSPVTMTSEAPQAMAVRRHTNPMGPRWLERGWGRRKGEGAERERERERTTMLNKNNNQIAQKTVSEKHAKVG